MCVHVHVGLRVHVWCVCVCEWLLLVNLISCHTYCGNAQLLYTRWSQVLLITTYLSAPTLLPPYPATLPTSLPPCSSFLHLQGLHSVSRAIIHVDDDAKKEGKGESYKLLVEGTDLLGVLGTVGEQPLVVPL